MDELDQRKHAAVSVADAVGITVFSCCLAGLFYFVSTRCNAGILRIITDIVLYRIMLGAADEKIRIRRRMYMYRAFAAVFVLTGLIYGVQLVWMLI